MKNKFKSLLPIIIVTIITAFVSIGAYYNILHKEYDKYNQILIDSSESMSQEIWIRFEDNINLLNILAKRIQHEGIINSKDKYYKFNTWCRCYIGFFENLCCISGQYGSFSGRFFIHSWWRNHIWWHLNGLKETNDKLGHEAGDELIRRTAEQFTKEFPKHSYRTGGDEFVVLHANIDKHEFYRKVETLVENLKMNDISISYGILWKEQCDNLELMLNEADKLMYENKKEFYSNSKYDRRKNRRE